MNYYMPLKTWRLITPAEGLVSLVKVENEAWNGMSDNQIKQKLMLGDTGTIASRGPEVNVYPFKDNPPLPLTFVFATKAGNHGLLQITELTDNPHRMKIGYKLTEGQVGVNPDTLDTHR